MCDAEPATTLRAPVVPPPSQLTDLLQNLTQEGEKTPRAWTNPEQITPKHAAGTLQTLQLVSKVCHSHESHGLYTHQGTKQSCFTIYICIYASQTLNINNYLFLKPGFRVWGWGFFLVSFFFVVGFWLVGFFCLLFSVVFFGGGGWLGVWGGGGGCLVFFKISAAQAGRLCLFISCQTQLNEIHRKMLVT